MLIIIIIIIIEINIKKWRCGGLNPGPFTCKANALPLSYIPIYYRTSVQYWKE